MKEAANAMLPGVECRFHSPQEPLFKTLPPQFRQDVFLLYKELLANIAKHSHASRVEINVSKLNGYWSLSVSDNGVGFDPTAEYGGNGLKNMRRRAARLKGELTFQSTPDRGTTADFSTRIV